MGLKSLLKFGPLVLITKDGIRDNTTMLKAGFLRWDEIREFVVYGYGYQVFLGIIPKDPRRKLKSLVYELLDYIGIDQRPAPFNIPQSALPISIGELVKYIRRFNPKAKVR